jgi:DNA-binding SARP family transcriptional activator
MHDYLAEEVMGRLPDDLQQFLMRAALLESIPEDHMGLVFPGEPTRVEELLWQAESMGLLLRRTRNSPSLRFHPLVRDFLEARAHAELGEEEVRHLHLHLAEMFDGIDWRVSAEHLVQAGNTDAIAPLINRSLEQILARGEYGVATRYLALSGPREATSVAVSVVESRFLLQQGDFQGARKAADLSVQRARNESVESLATVLLNASGIHHATFSKSVALDLADEVTRLSTDPYLVVRARAAVALQEMARAGDLMSLRAILTDLRDYQMAQGQWHFVGITELNLAVCEVWLGKPVECLRLCDDALLHIEQSSNGYEAASVEMARSLALGCLARWPEAEAAMKRALDAVHNPSRPEVVADTALQAAWFGRSDWAKSLSAELKVDSDFRVFSLIVLLTLAIDRGDHSQVSNYAAQLSVAPLLGSMDVELFHVQLALARAALAVGDPQFDLLHADVVATSRAQGSPLEGSIARLLGAIHDGPEMLSIAITEGDMSLPSAVLASQIVPHIDALDDSASIVIQTEVARRPEKWLPIIRSRLVSEALLSVRCLRLLELYGTAADVSMLAGLAIRGRKVPAAQSAAKQLATRLARRVLIQDLGRLQLIVDGQRIAAGAIRRKVLGLLAFLVAQPGMAVTRDQILDALWPDNDPSTALNSLNQTIYFLRRALEPHYRAGSSPDYVYFEGETVWLDSVLVSTSSHQLRELVRQSVGREDEMVEKVLSIYTGRFALDFAYEEWATTYRDSLHSAFLSVIESAATILEGRGQVDAAISVLRRSLEIDPEADALELRLLRLYRRSGAHAAAAEQYAHYAAVLRDELGVEPPTLESLADGLGQPGVDT